MIVYGTDKAALKSTAYSGKCVNCNTAGSVQIHLFQKYAQIFWIIPLFPLKKVGYSQCSNCKQVLDSTQFDSIYKMGYDALRTGSRTPVWSFSGLAIIAVLVAWIMITVKNNTEENRKLISSPKKGDIYEIKLGYQEYTLIRVSHLVEDTVYFNPHSYQTNKITGLSDLKRKGDEAYTEEIVSLLKGELLAKLESKEILDVER